VKKEEKEEPVRGAQNKRNLEDGFQSRKNETEPTATTSAKNAKRISAAGINSDEGRGGRRGVGEKMVALGIYWL